MAIRPTGKAEQLLRQALLSSEAALTDGQLLGRYVDRHDPAALEALVRRHGPMVWGVCRRLLGHHDAEDAFQATFLVLVRKAASVRPRAMLPNWLYGVARQTARKARSAISTRLGRERQVTPMPEPTAEAELARDLLPVLDEELNRLPDSYRLAIILCDLEGRTRQQVARQLGVPEGTVASRLARARTLLARRMVRHGLALSAGVLSATLARAAVEVPRYLTFATVRMTSAAAGGGLAAGLVSARVSSLAGGVVKAMFLGKLKAAGALLTALTLLIGGGGALGYRVLSADQAATAPEGSPAERSADELVVGRDGTARVAEAVAARANDQAKAEPAAGKFFYVDLQHKANQKLTDRFGSGHEGNDLAGLPRGEQTFGGVRFQIGDGLLQLNSELLKEQKAEEIKGIQLGHTFARLHFLHATCYGNGKVVADGVVIGEYRLFYEDGDAEVIPVVYGRDVRDFWLTDKAEGDTRGRVVWTGDNDYARQSNCRLRLYLMSWDNPHPRKTPNRIDYVKPDGTPAAPFCVAITVEK
jgi:RNA polymerase sigma factor (sigma-70 family)